MRRRFQTAITCCLDDFLQKKCSQLFKGFFLDEGRLPLCILVTREDKQIASDIDKNISATLSGEHAPRDGHNHCDRYVMCLFCSSFAIVGTADELWRLFSFQAFAEEELKHLESMLGSERTDNDALEDLRDRYRIAIPYIDQFTQRQFSARIVKEARTKTKGGLHPFWTHQMTMSRRARMRTPIIH